MIFSTAEEINIFISSILSGMAIAAFYDLIFVCSGKNRFPMIVWNVLDGIALSVSCAVLLYMTLSVSRGIVRLFEFAGVVLGIWVYRVLFHRMVCALFRCIIHFLCTFFKLFFKILLTPIEFTYKIFIKCINGLLCPFMRIGKRLQKAILLRLKDTVHILRRTRNKT